MFVLNWEENIKNWCSRSYSVNCNSFFFEVFTLLCYTCRLTKNIVCYTMEINCKKMVLCFGGKKIGCCYCCCCCCCMLEIATALSDGSSQFAQQNYFKKDEKKTSFFIKFVSPFQQETFFERWYFLYINVFCLFLMLEWIPLNVIEPMQPDQNKRLITLTVITLRGFYCI